MLQPGLFVRSGTFTSGKTSTSVGNARSYDSFQQINIFNQPTGYSHIEIRSANDLVNLVWDIYYYNLYYNAFEEKIELLNLYKDVVYNLEHYSYKDLFPNAYNIVKTHKFWPDFKTKIKLFLGIYPKCVLTPYQAQQQIIDIEQNYFKKREEYIEKYGDDLILNYFFNFSLDELQLYFGVRTFNQNFSGKNSFLVDFICFPVKLNCRIEGIVQNENMLDVYFRRQASSYLRNGRKLFGLLKTEQQFQPHDTEKVRYDDSQVISSSTSINFYKIFKIPKLQYYRNHLINSKSKDIYKPGLLFEYIKQMSDRYNEMNAKQKGK